MIENFQLISDIEFYKNEKEQYMVSSEKIGVYLILNKKLYDYLLALVSHINNKDSSINYIDRNIKDGISFLRKYNLLYPLGQEPERMTTVESEILGNRIWSKNILIERKSKILVYVLLILGITNLLCFVLNIILLQDYDLIYDITNGYQNFDYLRIENIIITILLISLSLISHEFGHACLANYFEVYIKNISLYLHFGVAPMVFVKYRDIYKKSKRQRIIIYSGGMIFNLFMINFSLLCLLIFDLWVFAALLIINVIMIINNITSFYNSDTYFILCEAFNFGSLKYMVLQVLKKLFCKEIRLRDCIKKRGFLKIFSYFMLSYIFKVVLLFNVTISVLNVLSFNDHIKYMVLFILVLYYAFNIMRYYTKIRTKVY